MAIYDVQDRSIIVTGGGSGIGRATALLLARSGASIVIGDVNPDSAEAVVAEITAAGGLATSVVGDLTDPAVSVAAVDAAQALAPLRGAVNSAGVGGGIPGPIGEYDLDQWRRILSINLDAVFLALRAQLPVIAGNGGGGVVTLSSTAGVVAAPGNAAYTASKHAVIGLTKVAALDYAAQDVRVNAVGPGVITTPLTDSLPPEVRSMLLQSHPLGRFGTPDEAANVIAFLVSDAASFVTGSYYPIDAGYTAV